MGRISIRIVTFASLILFTCAKATTTPADPEWPDSYPEWWYNAEDPANGVINAIKSTLNEDNDALLVVGQLKNIAMEARDELDIALAPIGGAGAEIDALVDSFTVISTDNLSAANIGQLKNVSSKFFDRLAEAGFTTDSEGWPASLNLDEGNGDDSPLYPWLDDVTLENNALANLGQAKHLFSWDLAAWVAGDTDIDGLPDDWEQQIIDAYPNFTIVMDVDPNTDFDGDGMLNVDEFNQGRIPTISDADVSLYVDNLLGDDTNYSGFSAVPGRPTVTDGPKASLTGAISVATNLDIILFQSGTFDETTINSNGNDLTLRINGPVTIR